jgi:hypothetical protein
MNCKNLNCSAYLKAISFQTLEMSQVLELFAFVENHGQVRDDGTSYDDYRDPKEVETTMHVAASCPTPLLPWTMKRQDRKAKAPLRARYSVWKWCQQLESGKAMLPACTWCGLPTGYWCDKCEVKGIRPMRAICNHCESEEHMCRPCQRGPN